MFRFIRKNFKRKKMITSEKTNNLNKALFDFQSKAGKVTKDSKGNFAKYASLTSVLDTIVPILKEVGVLLIQAPMNTVLVTRLTHVESGEYVECHHDLVSKDPNDPQKIGSSLTYARRYSLVSMLSLNVDDDDGSLASKEERKSIVKKDEKHLPELNTKSSKWPTAKQWILDNLKNRTKESVTEEINKSYTIGKDVIKFINDQK